MKLKKKKKVKFQELTADEHVSSYLWKLELWPETSPQIFHECAVQRRFGIKIGSLACT